jgi:beta-hydroxylase
MTQNIGIILLAIFVFSGLVVNFRGKVRYSFGRQLTSHTNITAPYNVFVYLFSKVPGTPFPGNQHFPELSILEDNWETIRDEGLALLRAESIKGSDKYDDASFNSFFRTGWGRFYLKWYDDALPSALQYCPRTVELIERVPSLNAAMFASLPPGSVLPVHRDPYAGSMRYHLGLITPNSKDCHILVDGIDYFWKDGEGVIFDETFVHTAENTTDEQRVILFCDIQRPMRYRWAERINLWVSKNLVKSLASRNTDSEDIGALNQVFGVLYHVRLVGKKIKQWNRTIYYALKYTLFVFLIWLIFF